MAKLPGPHVLAVGLGISRQALGPGAGRLLTRVRSRP